MQKVLLELGTARTSNTLTVPAQEHFLRQAHRPALKPPMKRQGLRGVLSLTFTSLFARVPSCAKAGLPRVQRRCWPGIRLRHIRQVHSPVIKAVAVQMHELMTRRAAADERLSHKLMHVLVMLVRVWFLVAEPLNGGPAGGLRVAVKVGTNRVRETYSRATCDEFDPVVSRVRRYDCQASRLVCLRVGHVI